ncbi:cbb3-type cytochrome c oxidase subunit 3 [Pseudomonas chlororaphis]|uniref:cbb3-type cytochrome c oxidase subunit 3 n=1 Tax=Pseudomonas chlororaphis TaxID=587753 RepID=UPI0037CC0792
MIEFALDLLGVTFLYLSIGYCLRHQSAKSLDDASLIPFADDPDVARRVELATGKKIDAVAPEPTEVRPGWGNVEV